MVAACTYGVDDESTQTRHYKQNPIVQSNATSAMHEKARQRRQHNDVVTNGTSVKEEAKETHYAETGRQKLSRTFFACLPLLTVLTTLWCCCKYAQYSLEETQHCNMTVMWFWPTFIEIELPDHASEQYPTYRTIVYGEGKYAKSLAQGNFNGTPVLFIPGNAGSDRQVRSLASVCYMKTKYYQEHNISRKSFNFFAVDFDEELTALSAEYFHRQLHYARLAALRILSLYDHEQRLLVYGHSIGGLIAARLGDVDALRDRIAVVFTYATPHTHAVLPYDTAIQTLYAPHQRHQQQSHLISAGGGTRDALVPSDLTVLPVKEDENSTLLRLSHVTPYMQHVWASADHLAIVWCNQLVTKTSRALYDLVEENTLRITDDVDKQRRALRMHFATNDDESEFGGMRHYAELLNSDDVDVRQLLADGTVEALQMKIEDSVHALPHKFNRFVEVQLPTSASLVLLTNRTSRHVAFMCYKRTTDTTSCNHNDRIEALHLHFLYHNWHGLLLEAPKSDDNGVLLISTDHSADAAHASDTFTFVSLTRESHFTLHLDLWQTLNPFWRYNVILDRPTKLYLHGYDESMLRAITIEASSCTSSNKTTAFLLAALYRNNIPTQRHSFFTAWPIDRNTMHIHHHLHSEVSGEDANESPYVLLLSVPHVCTGSIAVTVRSHPLKAFYVLLQSNSFGVRCVHRLTLCALCVLIASASCRKVLRLVALTFCAVFAYSTNNTIQETEEYSTDEYVVMMMFSVCFYVTLHILVHNVTDVLRHFYTHFEHIKHLHKSLRRIRVPKMTTQPIFIYSCLLFVALLLNGALALFIITVYQLIITIQNVPKQQNIARLLCTTLLTLLTAPSLLLLVQILFNGKTPLASDASLQPSVVCLVALLLLQLHYDDFLYTLIVTLSTAGTIFLSNSAQLHALQTWQSYATLLAPVAATCLTQELSYSTTRTTKLSISTSSKPKHA